ncbi:MAG: 23S rRNA (adenine2503-C2)-methyltransferase [Pseudomonadales bacterium]|jgi:23S rRNA (adenine2503-C2)-methyltransferase
MVTTTSSTTLSNTAGRPVVFDADNKVNLLGLTRPRLRDFFLQIGEKPFRTDQLLKWIHQRGVTNFDDMTDLSRALRLRLSEVAEVTPPEVVSEHISTDGTRKWAVKVTSGSLVETVFIPDGERGTLCISSQVGCTLDCSFCSTGKQGFQRDLTCAEIIGQVWLANRSLTKFDPHAKRAVTNVVMMGMGEPLLNFDNAIDAANLSMDDCAYGLSKRRVTLSTSGVVTAMKKMIGMTDVSLAVSLHAANNELRDELVPINKKYPIAVLLEAIKDYMDSLPDRRRVVTIEYTLIDGVNDSDEQALELVDVLRDTPCKINIIPFNPFPQSGYKKPSRRRTERFQNILFKAGYIVTVRTTRGDDIDAACGQLVGQVKDKTKRNERYQQKYAENNKDAEQVVRFVSAQQ